ncbi:phosphorylase [Leptospira yasudae]|uniref:Phosphorylase n=1 Tax=Leptospira yasudae TaxID=2202201 RepID=A0ABX9M103_9LEPT|nr:phosphorylase [Leptospira yasudae]RHX79035.1 phosphorylase [Leptospira yasudae]
MKIDPSKTLICSAISEELDQLAKSGKFQTLLCGIGNLEAALRLQRFLLEHQNKGLALPSQVMFVGSAGVYPWLHPSFWKNRFGFSFQIEHQELGKIERRIRIPEIVPDSYEFPHSFEFPPTNEVLISKTNATGSIAIETVSGKALEYLRENDLGFENMECFGLAKVCKDFQIPLYSFFALTNTVGPDGSSEWKSNYKRESARLQEFLLSFLL